jgi:hypothetical protein
MRSPMQAPSRNSAYRLPLLLPISRGWIFVRDGLGRKARVRWNTLCISRSRNAPDGLIPCGKAAMTRLGSVVLRSWIYLIAVISLWIAALGPLRRNAVKAEVTQQPEKVVAAAKAAAAPATKEAYQPSHSERSPDKRLPIIQEIRLDKEFVCRGEQNFVNVRATGPDGTDAQVRVNRGLTHGSVSAWGGQVPGSSPGATRSHQSSSFHVGDHYLPGGEHLPG